jgi:hypothetical protein
LLLAKIKLPKHRYWIQPDLPFNPLGYLDATREAAHGR